MWPKNTFLGKMPSSCISVHGMGTGRLVLTSPSYWCITAWLMPLLLGSGLWELIGIYPSGELLSKPAHEIEAKGSGWIKQDFSYSLYILCRGLTPLQGFYFLNSVWIIFCGIAVSYSCFVLVQLIIATRADCFPLILIELHPFYFRPLLQLGKIFLSSIPTVQSACRSSAGIEIVVLQCPNNGLKCPIAHLEETLAGQWWIILPLHPWRAPCTEQCPWWARFVWAQLSPAKMSCKVVKSSTHFMTWSHLLWLSVWDLFIVLRKNFGWSELL